MSLFGLFRKKASPSVTVHILDPIAGYSKEVWTVGEHVVREAVEQFSEDDNLIVVVIYEAGTPKHMICKRNIWNETKARFDAIEAEGEQSISQILSDLNELR